MPLAVPHQFIMAVLEEDMADLLQMRRQTYSGSVTCLEPQGYLVEEVR